MDVKINDGGDSSTSSTAGGGTQAPSQANAPPPFLCKTYDMVDDPATDAIVSWSRTDNSFVVWNPPGFSRDLLPKYFKHNNFSSFVRQLNTYGFRKVDPDRWEFANEGFLRGQKHLLTSISRRKPAHGPGQQQTQQPHGQSSSVGTCVEVGKFGLGEEVERLKRDKNVLVQELVRLRQQQQSTDGQLQTMAQRLQGMEQRQQQMMSFLAKAMQNPAVLAQFVWQQNDSNRRITEANKKRRVRQDGVSENESLDSQIVKYQPDAVKAMLRQIMEMEESSRMESYSDGLEGFLGGMASSSRISGVKLQDVTPSGILGHIPTPDINSSPNIASSEELTASFPEISTLVGLEEAGIAMEPLAQIPEMAPEGIVGIPGGGFMQAEGMDLSSLGMGDFSPGAGADMDFTNILFENPSFWDGLVTSPVVEDIGSSCMGGLEKGSDMEVVAWDRTQNVDQLAEQMGLLTSETAKKP